MSDFLSFRFPDSFVEQYEGKSPEWPFPIGGGNSLGELIYVDKYSALKEDGTKETWDETCQRVVEGYYSILKDHCFAGETEYITFEGLKTFAETVGTTQLVLSQHQSKTGRSRLDGRWVEAEIQSFGEQELWDVVISRNGEQKTIRSTSGHRWIASPHISGNSKMREVLTEDLTSGLYLGSLFNRDNLRTTSVSPFGVAHGFTYGDGTRDSSGGCKATLWGEKDAQLLPYFNDAPSTPQKTDNGVLGVKVTSLPSFFKELPSLAESFPYLYGWLAGYFAADGSVSKDGAAVLYSADRNALEFCQTVATKLGIGTWGIRESVNDNSYVDGPHTMYALSFIGATLRPEFFLTDVHRARFNGDDRKLPEHWRVISATPTGEHEETFCAVVPDTETFALAGNVWVGNCKGNRTPWNDMKALASARDAYDRMFNLKWLPPGRGIQHMGRAIIHEEQDSSPLQNCSFVSTSKLSTHSFRSATDPFRLMMEMAMTGVGVGFDTKGAGRLTLHEPTEEVERFIVPDTREGWADSVASQLATYFFKNRAGIEFDYDGIRPLGAPLKRFGGRASGPGPLIELHNTVKSQLDGRAGEDITSRDILDLMNKIGKAVQAGGSRRSAQIAFGAPDDEDYRSAKNWELKKNAERTDPKTGWAWNSNNSVFVDDDTDLGELVADTKVNGEPGFMWLDLARSHGRMIDPPNNKDYRVAGGNPCLEQSLEDQELCTLCETFPTRHEDYADFRETLKHAYLYGKAVTMLPTRWPESNEVMARNRRIGCSMSGLAEFVETKGWAEMIHWMDEGYKFIQHRDTKYSEWLAVRESIKTTSIKPSGTVSLLAGVTPGVHWPVATGDYIRRVRFSKGNPLVDVIRDAGYHVEDAEGDPDNTVVVTFLTQSPDMRSEQEVSIWEKAELAVVAQRYWADNQVSATVTFAPDEAEQILPLLESKSGQFKGISFNHLSAGTYSQQPYEQPSPQFVSGYHRKDHQRIDLYSVGGDAIGDKFCDNDSCEI